MINVSQVSSFQLIAKGDVKYALTILGPDQPVESETLGVEETFHCGFRIRNRKPGWEYTISIGDEPLDEPSAFSDEDCLAGDDISEDVVWPDSWHFESCVGIVYVTVLCRRSDTEGRWRRLAQLRMNVLPSKLGWERYNELLRDIKRVSAALIFDLVSKNKRNVGFRGAGISSEPTNVQLRRIERIWADLVAILSSIAENPTTSLTRKFAPVAPGQSLDAKSTLYAVGRGFVPIAGVTRGRALRVAESTDTYEHSLIKTVLELLITRLRECEDRAQRQSAQLRKDLPVWLDPAKAPEIIATEYMPRIERLKEVAESASRLRAAIGGVLALPLFANVRRAMDVVLSPVFQNVVAYNACFTTVLDYLRTSLWTLDEGLQERVKRTSRLFEHWVFMQLAAALMQLGFECIEHEGLYSIGSNNRFTLDLDKGTLLTFRLASGRFLRLRYEPWVFPKATAVSIRDGVYGPTAFAWNPDIVLEFCSGLSPNGCPIVTYAVVVDAKYTIKVAEHHWNRVTKYWKIRSSVSNRQVAMQLWLAFPSAEPARPLDDCVPWGGIGDLSEHIDGTIGLLPAQASKDDDQRVEACGNAIAFVSNLMSFIGEPLPSR